MTGEWQESPKKFLDDRGIEEIKEGTYFSDIFVVEAQILKLLCVNESFIDVIAINRKWFNDSIHQKIFDYIKKGGVSYALTNMSSNGTGEAERMLAIVSMETPGGGTGEQFRILSGLVGNLIEFYKYRLTREIQDDMYNLESQEKAKEFRTKLIEINELKVETYIEVREHLTPEHIDEVMMKETDYIEFYSFPITSRLSEIVAGDVVTIAAESGFGKSAFAMNLFVDMINQTDNDSSRYHCQYYNLEISEKTMIKRLLAISTDEPLSTFDEISMAGPEELKTYEKAKGLIAGKNCIIKNGSMELETLMQEILLNKNDDIQNIAIIDHIGLISVNDRNCRTEYDRISKCMRELRALALDNNITIFIVSQLNRESIKNGKITLASLKGSGEIENSSTHVIGLNYGSNTREDRENDTIEVVATLLKNRNGRIGRVKLIFDKLRQKFIESNDQTFKKD